MTIPCRSVKDLELAKFVLDSSGDEAVNVVVSDIDLTGVGTEINTYAEVSAVAKDTLTTIVTYTVPVGKTFRLSRIEASGSRMGIFTTLSGATIIDTKRSYFDNYNVVAEFGDEEFPAETVLTVKILHSRPTAGDFEARITGKVI